VKKAGELLSQNWNQLRIMTGLLIGHCHILIIKANEMHCFLNLFDKVLYMFRTGSVSIVRSISTLYTRSRYLSWWWTVDLSKTCRVLHQINLRNSASHWLLL
jgi:hypothetical protein